MITESVSSLEVARNIWLQAAARAGSGLAIIEVICHEENVHRQRLASRQRNIPGGSTSRQGMTSKRDAEWEPWNDERLVLDTMRSINENVAGTLDYLRR